MARIVVIGAGPGGLAVAARLATTGHEVQVCEQAERVGGALDRVERDGYAFETGPDVLTLPAVYRELFASTGAQLDEVLDLEPVDPVVRLRFADGVQVDLPNVSRPQIAAAWDAALGGGAGADWSSFLERAARIWDAARGPFLEQPQERPLELAHQPGRMADLRAIAPWRSLRGLGRQYLRHPHQRMALERYATYAGSDPRRAPALLAMVPFIEQSFGAWSVRGGLSRLARALHDRAVERGVTVRTGADVTQVVLDGAGRACGVRLSDGEVLAADAVVSGVDAMSLYHDLVGGPGAELARATLRRVRPSLSVVTLLLALDPSAAPLGLPRQTVLFPADYDDEFDSVFGTGVHRLRGPRAVPDPAITVRSQPATAPAAGEALVVSVSAPRHVATGAGDPAASRIRGIARGIDWDAPGFADSYADRLLALMAERGLDVRDRLRWREVITPADLERRTRRVGGSLCGSSSNTTRAAFMRPANRSPVPGLYLVGSSTHPGSGLAQAGLSARIVAGLIGKA